MTEAQAIDPLWEVLGAVRMTGGVFLDACFTAPWCVVADIGPGVVQQFIADPVQMVAYHYVVRGRMQITVDGETPLEVNAGEAVLLSRNDGHVLGSTLDRRPVDVASLLQPGESGGLARIEYGGGAEPTHIFCGFLGSDQSRNPLFATLPRILKVDLASAGSSDWIEASWSFAIKGLQEGRVSSSATMSRLSELMFVEAVRSYAATLPPGQKGWLSGMRDPVVGRALALMHGQANRNWTGEELAGLVALSRSAFTDRFTAFVGTSPMRYLTTWRMQLAQDKLRATRQSIAQIAYDVGYEAEEAFTRAFKREFGTPPAAWRKAAQVAVG